MNLVEDNRSVIYLGTRFILYLGKILDNTQHEHHYIQLTIALENQFDLEIMDNNQSYKGVIINSDYNHKLNGENCNKLLVLISPESEEGIRIKEILLKEQSLYLVREEEIDHIRELIKDFLSLIEEERNVEELYENIMRTFIKDIRINRNLDSRVQYLIDFMRNSEELNIPVKHMAKLVYLSESRLIHLFKEEIGIPIRQYILWIRIQKALRLMYNNYNLTEAAYSSGFSDSAHLSRTFRRMFGFSITEVIKNSKFIQLFFSTK